MLTLKQVRAQVEAIRRRSPDSFAIGLVSAVRWTGENELKVDGERYDLRAAETELEMRTVLVEAKRKNSRVVVLTNLDPSAIGKDLLARFARRRFFSISATEILGELFQAREVDPRLQQHRWMATALADARPAEGFAPVPQGALDQETAWRAFFEHVLRLPSARPDLVELLEWARDSNRVSGWRASSAEAQTAIKSWTEQSAGSPAALIWAAVAAGTSDSMISLGLVADILFRPGPVPADVAVARGRFERFFGDQHISPEAGTKLAAAALHWVELRAPSADVLRAELERADAILRELRIEEHANQSTVSPSGFGQRLGAFGHAVKAFLREPSAEGLSTVSRARDFAAKHRNHRIEQERSERVEMALRLCRWLLAREVSARPTDSFGILARRYAEEGSFVDWARQSLYHGDSQPELNQAYLELASAASERQEMFNRIFARALAAWCPTAESTPDLLLVEDVLAQRLAPLAARTPVVLVVLDGMSYPVYRQIIAALVEDNWAEAVPAGAPASIPAVAGLPTITEWSRRLLLAGRTNVAAGEDEAAAFRDAPALAGIVKPSHPPILFRKGDVMEAGSRGLSEDVRKEIRSSQRQVVAVVINAVDDHLMKDDQLQIQWTPERIPLLQQVLDIAQEARRCVLLATDHGHVITNNARLLRTAPSDRFRANEGTLADEEIVLAGGRASSHLSGGFVAPWSERIYYTSRRNGFHGGVSAQEVVIPATVLVPAGDAPEGWQLIAQTTPRWWWDAAAPVVVELSQLTTPARKSKKAATQDVQTLPLFATTTPAANDWIDQLLSNTLFIEQSRKAGRTTPSPETLKRVLSALDERGGVLLKTALAQRTGEPEFRLNGLLAILRRILNVEGYAVLSVDEAGTVRLDRGLLRTQFDV
ncbi:MAG: BREX-2 system phosphatase PglZ [Verrucomicrobia bacterium]|nr:BREX-2 system phosphatase PglZ [Verrucomicrobiota bacterium]